MLRLHHIRMFTIVLVKLRPEKTWRLVSSASRSWDAVAGLPTCWSLFWDIIQKWSSNGYKHLRCIYMSYSPCDWHMQQIQEKECIEKFKRSNFSFYSGTTSGYHVDHLNSKLLLQIFCSFSMWFQCLENQILKQGAWTLRCQASTCWPLCRRCNGMTNSGELGFTDETPHPCASKGWSRVKLPMATDG